MQPSRLPYDELLDLLSDSCTRLSKFTGDTYKLHTFIHLPSYWLITDKDLGDSFLNKINEDMKNDTHRAAFAEIYCNGKCILRNSVLIQPEKYDALFEVLEEALKSTVQFGMVHLKELAINVENLKPKTNEPK